MLELTVDNLLDAFQETIYEKIEHVQEALGITPEEPED